MDRALDLTGRKFGKWLVLPRRGFESNDANRKWLVQCECGRLRLVAGQDLLHGRSTSCGCASCTKNSDNGKTLARSVPLRKQLQLVMHELRPEGTGLTRKSQGSEDSM
jgi:hypothetical protein